MQNTISDSGQEPPITWVDIARTLAQLDPASLEWRERPASLVHAKVDWLSAVFEFTGDTIPVDAFFAWLGRVFPQRIERSNDAAYFLLEGPINSARLPIELALRVSPVLLSPVPLGAVEGSIDFSNAVPTVTSSIPLIACHSVKGGNGRTTTAIACATAWSERVKSPVLIVDADLEAPGLSYLYRRERANAQISFEDVIAIAHSDESSGWKATIDYVADRLRGQKLDNLFVLPLRRNLDELASSSIRAEHLSNADHPFALADILRAVAEKMGCAGVVVDIRAGLVPLATQLILDPSVSRIFVSSLSGQSIDGTLSLIKYLSREARRRNFILTRPMLVINRIPSLLRETGADEAILRPALDEMTFELVKGRQ